MVNLGRYFGLDVGGTLTKLVYFRRRDQLEVSEDREHREMINKKIYST